MNKKNTLVGNKFNNLNVAALQIIEDYNDYKGYFN